MVAKRKAVASKRKQHSCQPTEFSEVEFLLFEALVCFHGEYVKALQKLTMKLRKAKKRRGPLFTSPGGRQVGNHLLAVANLSTEMNQRMSDLMHQLGLPNRLPAAVRRALSRTTKGSVTRISDAAPPIR